MPSQYNYKKLLSEKLFLRVAERARTLTNSKLAAIDFTTTRIRFTTESGTRPGLYHRQEFLIVDLLNHMGLIESAKTVTTPYAYSKSAAMAKLSNMHPIMANKANEILKDSPIKVDCTCEAYLYWGFKYIATRKGYALYPEHRRPKIRNPHQKGYICKHIHRILTVWPFISRTISTELKRKGLIANSYPTLEAAHADYYKRAGLRAPEFTTIANQYQKNKLSTGLGNKAKFN